MVMGVEEEYHGSKGGMFHCHVELLGMSQAKFTTNNNSHGYNM